ncbi:MAG: transcription termination factor Rho [Planctomycetota bacterium]|nr:transcription termination factor Rho [Planctomycetota bacterium]
MQQGMQGMQGMAGSGRRKKKKRKGGGMPFPQPGAGPSAHHHQTSGNVQQMVAAGLLPSEEEIERDAQALERIAATSEYAQAEKAALHMSELQRMEIGKLHDFATREGLVEFNKLPRQELIFQLLKKKAADTGLIFGEGTLEIAHEGYGFLRSPEQSYLSSPDDIYVAPQMVRRFGLRKGMEIKGAIRPPKDNERYFTLLRIDSINGKEPAEARRLPIFEDLTPLHPEQRFVLETEPDQVEMRIVDLVAPIGRGQRGLIVAPPRTGKTVLLQKITQAISKNYPEVKIIVLLIDERPEEVTDFRRNTNKTVEVVASTFDEDSSRHVAVAEMVIEKARRYVEYGQHVVILLDSITRLARAYNAAQPHSGKIMTGGIDSNALVRPKKFFGSARAIENGGSLTILGTALVDTGSKADEVIFEEFKGTGNSELHLDRKLVDKRIWPAIDVAASGTRREELLLDKKELELTYRLRKVLADMNVVEAMELLKSRLKKAKTNAEFLMTMNIGA